MYSETCLIRTLCSKVTAGPTCESSNVVPQGCDGFSGPQILYYLKGAINFQVPKSVIYVKSDRFFNCIVFNARLLILQVQGAWSCSSLTSSAT